MPRFYLHLRRGGGVIEDPEGEDFPDLPQARATAIAAARDIVAAMVVRGEGIDGQAIVIADETGQALMVVPFSEAIKPDNEGRYSTVIYRSCPMSGDGPCDA